MTSIQLIIMISLAHLAAVISPGPDFVMVVKNALSYSRKIGVYTAIGIGSGIIVHVSYTFFGLGYFIQENTIFFKVIQYLGAAYLFYMGFTALFSSSSKHQLVKDAQTIKNISASKAFQIGFLTNVLNPKAALFFLGLFTALISETKNYFLLSFIGILLVVQTIAWFVLVSYFFTQIEIQKKYYHYEQRINQILGLILILLAISLLVFN